MTSCPPREALLQETAVLPSFLPRKVNLAGRPSIASGLTRDNSLHGMAARYRLGAQAARLELAPFVHFHGYMTLGPQLNEAYNRADIFALPSLSEGSPRVITEALGHSLPVVATPVGNIAESLDHGRRGVLVPLNDPPALAAGLARLIDEPEFRRQCIQQGYAFARQHGLDVFVARMAEKAHEMIAAARRQRT